MEAKLPVDLLHADLLFLAGMGGITCLKGYRIRAQALRCGSSDACSQNLLKRTRVKGGARKVRTAWLEEVGMKGKPMLVKLTLGLAAAVAFSAALFSAPAPATGACLAVCNSGWCCCGKVSATDRCTGKSVCVSQCLAP